MEVNAPSEKISTSVGTETECVAVQDNVTTTPKVTSRGRVVKLPEKLKDYVRL